MRVTITQTIPETPDHYTIAAGEWEAIAATWESSGRQRRDISGVILQRKTGSGWKFVKVPGEYWDGYLESGNIIIHQDGEDMNNLPAVKMESAFVPVSPQEQINQASDMARLLKEVVSKAGLARKLGGRKEHLEYEAWATIARWFHCTPSTEWTRPIKEGEKIIGWEARVNILDETGRVIGSSEGMCMSDEANWRNKPTYALRSMAQTRTAGKALRSLFAHIAVLAGYSPTPADEMDGVLTQDDGLRHAEPQANQIPDPTHDVTGKAYEATPAQKKKLFAMATEKFGSKEAGLAFITWCKGGDDHFTKSGISALFDDFDAQAALFADSQRAAN
jgi:hypothetical protein